MKRSAIWCPALLAYLALGATAQTFDVASVKPSAPGQRGWSLPPARNGRFWTANVSLKMLIGEAYGVQDYQVDGGPPWIDADRYDIEAKYTGKADIVRSRAMIQALLADRFQLTIHRTQKEMQAYMLTLAKGGSKMKDAKDPECSASPVSPLCGGFRIRNRNDVTGESVSMQQLSDILAQLLRTPVVDQTGLTKPVDLHVDWVPDGVSNSGEDATPASALGISLFTAMQNQLGLKLSPKKAPIDIVVIDRAEKATAN
jgi:uncharacterized protein (TIGR03435 family)